MGIGSPFVIHGMEGLIAGGVHNMVCFEANGRFLPGSRIDKEGLALVPLMTRCHVLLAGQGARGAATSHN